LKIIELTISPTGETKLETKGFTGSECEAASKQLEQALGLRQAETLTAEYHAANQSQQQDLRQQ
jgi:hypothetical protein